MTFNFAPHKIAKSNLANATATAATNNQAANGTYVIDQHNALADAVQIALNNTSASGSSEPDTLHDSYATIFVNATTGSDANDGLNANTAFLTIGKALDYLKSKKINDGFNLRLTGDFASPIDLRGISHAGSINGGYGVEFYLIVNGSLTIDDARPLFLPDNATDYTFYLGTNNTTWNINRTLHFSNAYVILAGTIISTLRYILGCKNSLLTLQVTKAGVTGNRNLLQAINSTVQLSACNISNFTGMWGIIHLIHSHVHELTATAGTGNNTAVTVSPRGTSSRTDPSSTFESGSYSI